MLDCPLLGSQHRSTYCWTGEIRTSGSSERAAQSANDEMAPAAAADAEGPDAEEEEAYPLGGPLARRRLAL